MNKIESMQPYKKLNKTQLAHPNPLKEVGYTDETFMAANPKQHMNIYNPDGKVLGTHKLRPKETRFYEFM